MGKIKGMDIIAEANERAEHNINPYYWFGRITSRTVAQWAIGKKLAIIFAPFYLIITILMVSQFPAAFQNGRGLQVVASSIVWVFLTAVQVIMAVQWWRSRGQKRVQPEPAPEKKKRQSKRRKDYH